jgi:hypothetical protein
MTEGSKRFTKISMKDSGVLFKLEEEINDRDTKEIAFRSVETPHPDFEEAMQNLVRGVRKILLWPEDYGLNAIRVTGVSLSMSESTGVQGAVITGTVSLETTNSPFCFNTPHLPFDEYSEGAEQPVMPPFVVDMIERLQAEAFAYMEDGKRAQGNLFEDAA